jgi:predicted molibdopterin-dependent oxidoreductase YjgC
VIRQNRYTPAQRGYTDFAETFTDVLELKMATLQTLRELPLQEAGIKKTRSVCGYCGVGCSVDIMSKGNRIIGIQPAMDGPANLGSLCVKGQFAYDYVNHPDRLKHPLVRGEDGQLHETTWEVALARAAKGFSDVVSGHGREAVYGIASGRTPTEADYAMQKFIRASFGTHNIDNCSRA